MLHFAPIIESWGVSTLADALSLPPKNIRRWLDCDSIPAEWFSAVARAAVHAGRSDVTVERLAAIAEARRVAKSLRRG